MELYGIIWNYMELYGIIWNYMELYGIKNTNVANYWLFTYVKVMNVQNGRPGYNAPLKPSITKRQMF